MKANVKEIVGPTCIAMEDGDILYRMIHPPLKQHEPVELDFAGVKLYASPFLNAAVGQLLEDIEPDELKGLLKCENMTDLGRELLGRVVDNAKTYYHDPKARAAVDRVLSRLPED